MSTVWYLYVCAGISWGGCGISHRAPMPSEEACFKSLAALRFDEGAPGETRRSAVAYCYPDQPQPATEVKP